MKKVTKAVIPAAGLGTRVLPATKAMPKGMLPIVDFAINNAFAEPSSIWWKRPCVPASPTS